MVKKSSKKAAAENEPEVDDPEVDDDEELEEDSSKLTLPSSRVTAMLRKKLAGLRFSAENGVFATGAVEAVINSIIKSIKETSDAGSGTGKTKRATFNSLIRAIRTDPDLSRVFAAYTFTPGKDAKLRISPKVFLNGEDAAAYDAKRAAEKEERKKAKAVPAIGES